MTEHIKENMHSLLFISRLHFALDAMLAGEHIVREIAYVES